MLLALSAVVVALGIAAVSFFGGVKVGASVQSQMNAIEKVDRAFLDLQAAMHGLESDELSIPHRQLLIQMRFSLVTLGSLTKTRSFEACNNNNKRALFDAARYITAHPDPVLLDREPLLLRGLQFCNDAAESGGVTVSLMTTGKTR